MIVDALGEPVVTEGFEEPSARALLAALVAHSNRCVLDPKRAGVDCLMSGETLRGPNRARVKIFVPRRGTTVAFVYKDSRLPFSDDRFSYGALILKGTEVSPDVIDGFLRYLDSGLDPTLRPRELKRAFPFTVPR